MLTINYIRSADGSRQASAEEEKYIRGCLAYFATTFEKKSIMSLLPLFGLNETVVLNSLSTGSFECRDVGFKEDPGMKEGHRRKGHLVSSSALPYDGELMSDVDLILPPNLPVVSDSTYGVLITLKDTHGRALGHCVAYPFIAGYEFTEQMMQRG